MYPNSALSAWQLAVMAVVAVTALAVWLTAVYLAARDTGGQAGAAAGSPADAAASSPASLPAGSAAAQPPAEVPHADRRAA